MKTWLIRLLLLALLVLAVRSIVNVYSSGIEAHYDAQEEFAERAGQARGAAVERQVEELGAERDARAAEILEAAGGSR